MKTKELKKLIKEESTKVEIPDVSLNIMKKLESYQKPQVIETKVQKRFQFRLSFGLALSAVLILFLSFGALSINAQDPMTDDSIIEAVVLSTMTSSTIAVEQLDYETSVIEVSNPFISDQTTQSAIQNELLHLNKYLGVIENMLVTSNQYQISKQSTRMFSGRYQMQFESTNMADETSSYEVSYQKTSREQQMYMISGTVNKNGNAYQLEINYNTENNTITTKTYQNQFKYVEVNYENVDQVSQYTIKSYVNNTLDEQVLISLNSTNQIQFDFENSDASGTYTFELVQTMMGMMSRKYLNVEYNIDGNIGQLRISISQLTNATYDAEVIPNNGQSFTTTFGRWN